MGHKKLYIGLKGFVLFWGGVFDGARMGQKISAKQLKTSEGGDSSCANTLLYDCFLLTSTHYKLIVPPILNKPSWAD
ncbi:hypothetical protein CIPOMA221M_15180 [Citrobacter portucalensis]